MTDPPGVQPALGVDSVEWFPAGGNRLTVRVTGRWLRRPAAAHGQPLLVVTADGRRHRFPAIPEPPSLTGTPPGVWRTSFSVPAWIAPHLSRRLALQIGAVTIPLPGAVSVTPVGEPPVGRGEREPESPDRESEPSLAAEPATPLPSDEEIDAALDELAKAEARVQELEQETAELRRQADETEAPTASPSGDAPSPPGRPLHWVAEPLRQEAHIAHGASVPPKPRSPAESTESRGLRREMQMRAALARRGPVEQGAPAPARADLPPSAAESPSATRPRPQGAPDVSGQVATMERTLAELRRELAARTESEGRLTGTVAALRRDLQERTAAEAKVRAMLQSVQAGLDARIASQSLLERTLEDLRAELAELRATSEHELAAHREEQARSSALTRRVTELEEQVAETSAAREASEAEARRLAIELATVRKELEDTRELSSRDTAALGEAESLLARAHKLAADAQEQLAGARTRVRQAEAARDELEREFAEYRARSVRVHAAIDELRRQLAAVRDSHRSAPAAEPEPQAGEPPTETAVPEPPIPQPEAQAPEVEPERLTEALARLRETTTEPEPEPATAAEPAPATEPKPEPAAVGPWLERVMKRLATDDPTTAGRLLLGLLPAQRLIDQRPMAYDIALEDDELVRVTVTDAGVAVERGGEPREPKELAFRVTGDLAGLGRLVTSSAVRRRFGRSVARIKGDRGEARALLELAGAKLGLRDLAIAGARLDVPLALTVVSLLVEPEWTAGERSTIAFVTPGTEVRTNYLHIRDGQPAEVGDEAPVGPVATTVVCSTDSLLGLLAGERADDVGVHGDERPLTLLLGWIERAQSG